MHIDLRPGGLGGEFLILDDDNPHDGNGPKYATLRILVMVESQFMTLIQVLVAKTKNYKE
jgi:hypothetical protein